MTLSRNLVPSFLHQGSRSLEGKNGLSNFTLLIKAELELELRSPDTHSSIVCHSRLGKEAKHPPKLSFVHLKNTSQGPALCLFFFFLLPSRFFSMSEFSAVLLWCVNCGFLWIYPICAASWAWGLRSFVSFEKFSIVMSWVIPSASCSSSHHSETLCGCRTFENYTALKWDRRQASILFKK